MSDTIELYNCAAQAPFLKMKSSFAPLEGDLLSIRGRTWEVLGRSFSVDNANEQHSSIRCNVIVKLAQKDCHPPQEQR